MNRPGPRVGSDGEQKPATPESADMDRSSQNQDRESLTARIRSEIGTRGNVAPDDLEVSYHNEIAVPGVAIFSARQKSGHPRDRLYVSGVAHAGEIIIDRDKAMRAVVSAWQYGDRRTVPAVSFAAVIGFLEKIRAPARPILEPNDLAFFQRTEREEYARAAFLPREITVAGRPAVQYCNRAEARVAFWITTAIIQPDGAVKLEIQQIPMGGR